MSTIDLLSAVSGGLATAKTLGYSTASAAHDVYEAYVLTLLLRAAKRQGWTWDLRDTSGKITTDAIFRMAPGRLPSGNFTHVLLSKAGNSDLEAHIGIKVVGNSNVRHEYDLLVLSASTAKTCRALNEDPAHSDVVAHAEAKYYNSNLTLPLGRAYLGLAADCNLPGKSVLVTNQNGRTVEELSIFYGLDFRFLIKPSNTIGEYHLIRCFEKFLISAP